MAPDQTPLLQTLFSSLTAIDQRLSRIETALRIPAPTTSQPVAWTTPQQAASSQSETPPRPIYPAVKPLEPPPEGFPVTSRANMQDELDNWTVPRGYSMRINGTRTHGSRQKIRLVCFRGGRIRPPRRDPVPPEVIAAAKAAGKRKPTTDRASKKCDCPFKFELVELGPGLDRYVVHYTNKDNMSHNHAPSDLKLDPRARKLPPQVTVEVDQWLRDNVAIAKIQEELKKRGYAHVLDFDLRNRKRALQKKDGLLNGGGGAAVADGGGLEGLEEGDTLEHTFEVMDEDVDADGIDDLDGE